MRRHLARMGFVWSHTKKHDYCGKAAEFVNKDMTIFMRSEKINRKSSAEQYQLVYVDESFLHHHYGAQFSWFSDGDFVERSAGKGRRWCFLSRPHGRRIAGGRTPYV